MVVTHDLVERGPEWTTRGTNSKFMWRIGRAAQGAVLLQHAFLQFLIIEPLNPRCAFVLFWSHPRSRTIQSSAWGGESKLATSLGGYVTDLPMDVAAKVAWMARRQPPFLHQRNKSLDLRCHLDWMFSSPCCKRPVDLWRFAWTWKVSQPSILAYLWGECAAARLRDAEPGAGKVVPGLRRLRATCRQQGRRRERSHRPWRMPSKPRMKR